MDLEKIEAVIRPFVEKSGFQLYDVEFLGRILRVSIEKTEGVSLQDCVEITRLLNPLLDVEDLVPGGRYELEVSSPGLDRRLRRPEHFKGAVGSEITVHTGQPLSEWNGTDAYFTNRRKIRAMLASFDEGENVLNLKADGRETKIPLSGVSKAHVEFVLKTTPKKGKKDNNGR